jgi:hypothetical protein
MSEGCEVYAHRPMPDAAGRIILVCKLNGGSRWWSRRTKDVGADNANPQLLELPADRIAGAAAQLRQRFGVTVIDSPPQCTRRSGLSQALLIWP